MRKIWLQDRAAHVLRMNVNPSSSRTPGPTPAPSLSSDMLVIPSQTPVKNEIALRRTSYRRTRDYEEIRKTKQARRRDLEEQARRLSLPLDSQTRMKRPVMLIDGYNVLFRDRHLKKMFEIDPDLGRGELESWVERYTDIVKIDCMLVYDAMWSRSRRTGTYKKIGEHLVATFVNQSEADTFIVEKAWRYQSMGAKQVFVVSSDNQIEIGITDEERVIVSQPSDWFLEVLHDCAKGEAGHLQHFRGLSEASKEALQHFHSSRKPPSTEKEPNPVADGAFRDFEDQLEEIVERHCDPDSWLKVMDNRFLENRVSYKGREQQSKAINSVGAVPADLNALLNSKIV